MIVSPVDGDLNDRAPRTGEYATAGHSVLSEVDQHSFRVDGYFVETKIHRMTSGNRSISKQSHGRAVHLMRARRKESERSFVPVALAISL
jgi:hypothetical protein